MPSARTIFKCALHLSLVWYVNFDNVSWNGVCDSLGDFAKPVSYELPSCLAEHDDRDFSIEQILLVSNVSIRRDEDFEAGGFCRVQQLAVRQSVQPRERASSTT